MRSNNELCVLSFIHSWATISALRISSSVIPRTTKCKKLLEQHHFKTHIQFSFDIKSMSTRYQLILSNDTVPWKFREKERGVCKYYERHNLNQKIPVQTQTAVFLEKIQNLHVITYTNHPLPLKPFSSTFMYSISFT